jgi:hypothetical protein
MLKPRPAQFKAPCAILIVCEDTKSSVYYLQEKIKDCGLLKTATVEKIKSPEIAVDVEGSQEGSSPDKVVESAIIKRDEYNRKAKKNGLYPYQEVYCVMDVDNHGTLSKAVEEIVRVNKITPESELIHIISNECFELWYVLHFTEKFSAAPLHRPPSKKRKSPRRMFIPDDQRFDKLLEKFLGQAYAKNEARIFNLINDNGGKEDQAIGNAVRLEEYHNGHSPEKPAYAFNPSTEVYKLIVRLNGLSELKKPVNPSQVELGDITQADLKNSGYPFQDDDFTNTLLRLVNQEYPKATKEEKITRLKDMFKNPYGNTACVEKVEIAGFFYQHYSKYEKLQCL